MFDVSDLSSDDELMEQRIKTWSYTRLSTWETCARRAKLAYIDRIPEPERPLPPGKTEHANDRGTRIHDAGERYVRGGTELIPELAKYFRPEFEKMRELFAQGRVSLEGEWAFKSDWTPTPWASNDAWGRIKIDSFVWLTDTTAAVIDYKSGKMCGNETKHAEQTNLYQLGSFIKYPKLENIVTELWYIDQNQMSPKRSYRRDQGLKFIASWERRIKAMTSDTKFEPSPSQSRCRWCPYKPVEKGGTGHCAVGV